MEEVIGFRAILARERGGLHPQVFGQLPPFLQGGVDEALAPARSAALAAPRALKAQALGVHARINVTHFPILA